MLVGGEGASGRWEGARGRGRVLVGDKMLKLGAETEVQNGIEHQCFI